MTTDAVVVAEKMCHKGQLHGALGYGGAIVNISDGIAIKFIAVNEKFVTVQILNSGIGVPIKNQSWQKAKVIKEKVVVEKAPKKPAIKEGEQVQLTDNIEQDSLL